MSSLRIVVFAMSLVSIAQCLSADDDGGPQAEPAIAADKPQLSSARRDLPPTAETIAELTARVRKSVAVITFRGRNGRQEGMGSGFVVSPDGLIATNLHVIGEARPIEVRLSDDRRYEVQAVHATERSMDLAVLRIDAKNLPALELADSDALEQGQPVVALGNPLGLEHSVVSGLVSGRRQIDTVPLIQLAMPIEPGNSGGPLIDMQGRVHGILTLKSLVNKNVGFAVAINALKPLLERPNPVPMSRWLTIGALDPTEWTPLFGAQWRQRAGRILVEGHGEGFGGRSLSLWRHTVPELPLELAVSVRMRDESGAAGIAFHADGQQKHFAFYPTSGKLRLSRFDGPDVFTWHVLKEVRAPSYHPGEWNRLKVRLERERILCFVNDELAIESVGQWNAAGRVGLAKFRDTVAEFKGFQVAQNILAVNPPAEEIERITQLVADIAPNAPPGDELIDKLEPLADAGSGVLREQARLLEQRAQQLRQLARAVHEKKTRTALAALLKREDQDIDLLRAALMIARLDNDEVEIDSYLREVDRMAEEIAATFAQDADEPAKLQALDNYLFEELGFHGSRTDYGNRSNSYLNEVIDDREGLPITLSVLYMELARRVGLKVVGVGLPGHFIVRFEPQSGDAQLIDPFDRGRRLTREQAAEKVRIDGQELSDEQLATQSKRTIIVRMLRNLMHRAFEENDSEGMLRYGETLVPIEPDSVEHRWVRARLRFQTGRIDGALEDTDWLLKTLPPEIDSRNLREFRNDIEQSRP